MEKGINQEWQKIQYFVLYWKLNFISFGWSFASNKNEILNPLSEFVFPIFQFSKIIYICVCMCVCVCVCVCIKSFRYMCNITDGRRHWIAAVSRLENVRAHQLSPVIGYIGLTIKNVMNLARAGRVTYRVQAWF